MDLFQSSKRKRPAQVLSLMLAAVLCLSMAAVPLPVHAADAVELPDTLTPEMAEAFVECLLADDWRPDENDPARADGYYEDPTGLFAAIETLGPDRYPVLHIKEEYDDSVGGYADAWFLYTNGKLDKVAGELTNDMGNTKSCAISKVDGVNYFVHGAYQTDSRQVTFSNDFTIYTVENGRWTEVCRFGCSSDLIPVEDLPYHVSDPTELSALQSKINEGSDFTMETSGYSWEYWFDYNGTVISYSQAEFSEKGGAPAAITKDEYIAYVDKYVRSNEEAPLFAPADLVAALQAYAITSNYDLEDELSAVSDEDLDKMNAAIAKLYRKDSSFMVSKADQDSLFDVAEYLIIRSMIPASEENYTDSNISERVVPCETVNRTLYRLTGRTIDFTLYQVKELPDDSQIEADVNASDLGRSYIYGENWYYFCNPGWLTGDVAWIQHFFKIEDDIFLAQATVESVGWDVEDIRPLGTVYAIFEKVGEDHRLVKIYPLNGSPSIEEVRQDVSPAPVEVVEDPPAPEEVEEPPASISPVVIGGAAVVCCGGIGAVVYIILGRKKSAGKKSGS